MNQEIREAIKARINFIVIGLVSFVGMGIIPFLAASINMDSDEEIIKTAFPHSKLGWIMWAIFRLMVIIINIMIYVAFVNQGKANVKSEKSVIEALKRWNDVNVYKGKQKSHKRPNLPDTPNKHYAKLYSKKGLIIATMTFASLFSITYMTLNWDLVTFLSITIAIILSIVMGIISMHKEELYWTSDFIVRVDIEYSKMMEELENDKTRQ